MDGQVNVGGTEFQNGEPEVDLEKYTLKNLLKVASTRLCLRLLAIVCIGVAFYFIPIVEWTLEYCDWIAGFDLWMQALFFILGGTIFHTFMPTGYLPTILSGLTFADNFLVGWTVSYTSVNIGSLLNILWVRSCNSHFMENVLGRKLEGFAFVNILISHHPFKTVLLFRMPYLYVGTVNYLFAFSKVEFRTYILANAVGFITGSGLFTALGRSGKNLFKLLSSSHEISTHELVIECSIFVVVLVTTVVAIVFGKRVLDAEEKRINAEVLLDLTDDTSEGNQIEVVGNVNHATE